MRGRAAEDRSDDTLVSEDPRVTRAWGGRAVIGLGTPASAQVLVELPGLSRQLREPGLLLGVVFHVRPLPPAGAAPVGLFRLVGLVRFQAGAGGGEVEFDIPAEGAAIAVPASDGFIVRCYGEGTENLQAEVSAACCITRTPFPRQAFRTHENVLPMAAHRAVPEYTRELLSATSNVVAGFASVNCSFWNQQGSVAPRAVFPAAAFPMPVPGGFEFYRLVDALGVAQNITTVWGLSL